jgi:phenylacetate-CoA ligase
VRRHKDLKNKHYVNWFSFLKKTEKWSRKEIENYQIKKIKQVVKNAHENTSGYKELYKRVGVKPSDIKDLKDLTKFPTITNETVRDDLESFSIKTPNRQYVTTGGSTGIPFGFYWNKEIFAKELASKAYQYYRFGWREGMKQMVFRGLPIDTPDHTQFFPEFNELRCSSYYLTSKQMEVYRKVAWKYKPDFIKCYPSSGYLFAKFLKESDRQFPPLKGILCASENLYDFQKDLLSRVFNCRVFSHYGHYELSVLAGFCEYEDTYHVLPQYGYAELLDQKGNRITKPGETGEIVATSFIMDITPFIRYRTRDFATFKGYSCPSCKRPYQIWEKIDGRLQEFAITKKGRPISMAAINMHDNIFDHIKQFQFYQEKKGEICFNYIAKETCIEEIINDMVDRLKKKFGEDMKIVPREVNKIPSTERGKHRFLIQKLKINLGD